MNLVLLGYQEQLADYNTKLLKETPFNEALAHVTLGIIEEIHEYNDANTLDELGDVLAYTSLALSLLGAPAIVPAKGDIKCDFYDIPGIIKRIMRGDSKKDYRQLAIDNLLDLLWCIDQWASEDEDNFDIEYVAQINIAKIANRVATTGFVKD